jgi:PAS domain S-box-containing protein
MAIIKKDQPIQKSVEQEEAGEALRQIKLVVDNSYDAIIGEKLDGTITSWNGGAERMFGYSAQEMIGKSVLSFIPDEQKDKTLEVFKKIKAGEVVTDYDSVRLRKDGTRVEVAFSSSPIKLEDGTIIGVSVVERDITERKKEEEKLRQTKLVVDNSYDAIIGETLDGTITTWNGGAERMFGYLAREMIGKSVSLLLPDEMKEEMPVLLAKVKAGEFIADYDSVMLRKDGSKIEVAFSGSPIKTEDGTIIGVSVVERDITERKMGERHIKELNEIRSKFITIMSHQLRTPLTAVNWNLETLLSGKFGKFEDMQHKFLQITYNASVEITNRINNLLMAIDVEEGRIRYITEEVDINSLCVGVVNEALKRCELKNLSCAYTPPKGTSPLVDGDGEKIRMVISAFIENAIGYTKEGGKITAALQSKNGVVKFEVVDTGVGIPQAEQPSIFTRFFRASNASTMQPDAFGLGLFLSKNFIEQHNGKIGFESKEGEGSKFWFEIPIKNKVESKK